MSKQDYLKRASAEVERAKRRLPDYAGDCSACRWSRRGYRRTCEHPATVCAAFNITDAYARREMQECDYQRDTGHIYGPVVCGPDGALFERKAPWWARLFGQSERTEA